MAIVSSLARALRETAERAIVHLRPPGPLKPPKAKVSNYGGLKETAYNGPSPLFATTSPLYASPAAHSASTLQNAFKSFFDHAISPVFIGLRAPGSPSFNRAINSIWKQSLCAANPFLSNVRAGTGRSKIIDAVKNRSRNFHGGADVIFAPSLGLRAAVDELDEKLRGFNKKGKKDDCKAGRSRCSPNESLSSSKGRAWNLARYLNELDCTYTPSPTVSIYSLEEHSSLDDDSSCSSSVIELLEQRANYILAAKEIPDWVGNTQSAEDDSTEDILDEAVVEEAEISFWTFFNIPLEPPPQRPVEIEDSLRGSSIISTPIFEGAAEISTAYSDYDLQVIQTLNHAVHHGYLSKLDPRGWNDPTAYCRILEGGRQEAAFMRLTFANCHADQVKQALQLDLTPLLFMKLQRHVHEGGVDILADSIAPEEGIGREEEDGKHFTQDCRALQYPQPNLTASSDHDQSSSMFNLLM